MSRTLVIMAIVFGLWGGSITAQSAIPESLPLTDIGRRTHAAMKEQAALYNGRDYIFFSPQIEGSGYFMDKEWEIGTVTYDGQRYENVPLMYDLVKDLVVSRLTDGRTSFSLISEKVSEFSFLNRHFIRISAGEAATHRLTAGFYERLHNGKLVALARHTKILETAQTREEVRQYFNSRTNYLIYKDGKYQTINSEGAFLGLFKADKAAMKKRLKEAKVNYKKDSAKAIKLLLAYYEGLNN